MASNRGGIFSPQSFVLCQVLASTLPGLIFWSGVPNMLHLYGVSLSLIGIYFSIQRMLGLVGPFFGAKIALRIGVAWTAVAAEMIIALLMFGAFFSVNDSELGIGFWIFSLVSVVASGVLVNSRIALLKEIELGGRSSTQIVKWIAVLIQMGYGLGGAVLLLIGTSRAGCRWLILINAITSLLGATLFWASVRPSTGQKSLSISSDKASSSMSWTEVFQLIQKGEISNLFLSAVCVYAAFGGANVLVLKAGETLFRTIGGYPMGLLIYGLAFLMGGVFVRSFPKDKIQRFGDHFQIVFPIVILVALAGVFMLKMSSPLIATGWFALLFTLYAILLVQFEGAIFDSADPGNVSRLFAFLGLCTGTVWAIGEAFYAQVSVQTEYSIRAGLLVFGFLFWKRFVASKERQRAVSRKKPQLHLSDVIP